MAMLAMVTRGGAASVPGYGAAISACAQAIINKYYYYYYYYYYYVYIYIYMIYIYIYI